MILNKEHQFAFVHIPKCAGTTVRNPLRDYDSSHGYFSRVDQHSVLGRLDYGHIPLHVLREHFPEEFAMVCNYWSFAVVRDPFARFASSVSQRLRMYSERPLHMMAEREVRQVMDACIDYLSGQPRQVHCLPPEYIHFQKQVDYIQLEGDRVVDTLYRVDEIDRLLVDVGRQTGHVLVLEPQKTVDNQTLVYRNDALRIIFNSLRMLRKPTKKLVSKKVRQRVCDLIFVPRDERMKALFAQQHVRDFVSEYYAEDLALFEGLRQQTAQR